MSNGRGAPEGTRKTFKRSPSAPQSPPSHGPKRAEATKTEINFNGILMASPILNVQKIARIAVIAASIDKAHNLYTENFGNFKIFFIEKTLSVIATKRV